MPGRTSRRSADSAGRRARRSSSSPPEEPGPGWPVDAAPGAAEPPGGKSPTGGQADDPRRDPDADPAAVARAICLRQLTMMPRTRAQLEQKLAERNVPAEVAAAVLDRFTEVGLIDDAAFAQAWVRSRHTVRGLARPALAQELRRRGIDAPTAAAALETLDDDTEREAALRLVRRRLPATRGLPEETRVRRLAGMLARKGYGACTAFGVVRAALAEEAQEFPASEASTGEFPASTSRARGVSPTITVD